ncbi:hypothetical protein KIL84_010093 [Mauremys mutica]|uniref:Uncharacterized protein n=1 Tax=Mauremys mutica TaxID=74926 RepID=A0A9D4B6T0_9SAUR|nr:hypothetical protein KIL84_010093 [Mauremys mutica]
MVPWAKPVSVPFWLLSLCSATSPGVHHLSYLQLISPQAAPDLPKWLNVERMNDLVLSANDRRTSRLVPCHGYTLGNQETDLVLESRQSSVYLGTPGWKPSTRPWYWR